MNVHDEATLAAVWYGNSKFDTAEEATMCRKAMMLLNEAGTAEAEEWLNKEADDGLTIVDVQDILYFFGDQRKSNLTEFDIRRIRKMRAQDNPVSLKILAAEYHVSKSLISKIARRIVYKNVK